MNRAEEYHDLMTMLEEQKHRLATIYSQITRDDERIGQFVAIVRRDDADRVAPMPNGLRNLVEAAVWYAYKGDLPAVYYLAGQYIMIAQTDGELIEDQATRERIADILLESLQEQGFLI